MSLKIFFIPFFVICTLVVAIGYVKPSVVTLMTKYHDLERLDSEMISLETVESNIASMASQIATSQSDSRSTLTDVDFLREVYFPVSSDIERGIDQLNFLATQSGLIVTSIEVQDIVKAKPVVVTAEDSTKASADILIANPATDVNSASPVVAVHRTYTPDMATVKVETQGSYEATKSFYSRVVHAQRFSLFQDILLSIDESNDGVVPSGVAKKGISDLLVSKAEVRFFVLPAVEGVTAVGDDVFLKTKLDFEMFAMIRQDDKAELTRLPAANSLGKVNPFIK